MAGRLSMRLKNGSYVYYWTNPKEMNKISIDNVSFENQRVTFEFTDGSGKKLVSATAGETIPVKIDEEEFGLRVNKTGSKSAYITVEANENINVWCTKSAEDDVVNEKSRKYDRSGIAG